MRRAFPATGTLRGPGDLTLRTTIVATTGTLPVVTFSQERSMILPANFDDGSDGTATGIQDHEIVQIAIFKLRDCASRLETLASAGPDSPLGEQLRRIVAELRQKECELLRHTQGSTARAGVRETRRFRP